MSDKIYDSLDELAKDYVPGERLRYHPRFHLNPEWSEVAMVVGYVYTLPLEPGGCDEPALVVETRGTLGHVYPCEIIK